MDLLYDEKKGSVVISLRPSKNELDFDAISLLEIFLEEYREHKRRVPPFTRAFFETARTSEQKTAFVFGPECMESGVDFLEDLCVELVENNLDPGDIVSFLDMVVDFCGDSTKIH